MHPKSDSQRKSLLEAVKEILLFRSLDSEQLNEVLDAMFERKVTPNEYIIKQGDDGDNFYVVERLVIRKSIGCAHTRELGWHIVETPRTSVHSSNSSFWYFSVARTTFL